MNQQQPNTYPLPNIQDTISDVFIIESLKKQDEFAKRYEGRVLAETLWLGDKNPKYFYFQSRAELPHLIQIFRQSRYRFLHISAHASKNDIGFTNESVTYEDFAEMFAGHLPLRRVFFSACSVGNEYFVETLAAGNKGMHSIAAPTTKIEFNHAVTIWSAFYASMFAENENAMKSSGIAKRLRAFSGLFPVDFYFARYRAKHDKWKHELVSERNQDVEGDDDM